MSNKKAFGLAAVVIGVLALLLGPGAICGDWSSAEVIEPRDGDYFASIVIDADDALHVAYLYAPDFSAPEIVYSSNVSGDWEREIVAELPTLTGTRPDIAVNANKQPFIVYSTLPTEAPKLAHFQDWFWDISDCPYEQMAHGAPLICVDSSGNPHVVFCYADGSIQYLCRKGLFWQRDVLDANASEVTGIVIDSSSRPHVVFLDREGNLMCAKLSDGDWEYDLVASPVFGRIGLWDSLTIDDQDNMRIAYLDGTPPLSSTLLCAKKTGAFWETETLEDGGIWAQIAFGASYTAQIAHVQSYSQDDAARYLYEDDLGWHSEDIPLERYGQWSLASRMTVMTADSEHLHIVYAGKDETNDGGGALLYIRGEQGQAVVGVSAELSLSGDSFKMHDTMVVSAHVTNGRDDVAIEAKVWIENPNGDVVSVLDPCSVFTINAETDTTVIVSEWTFTGTEAPGDYEIFARLIHPITGEEFSLHSQTYHFSAF